MCSCPRFFCCLFFNSLWVVMAEQPPGNFLPNPREIELVFTMNPAPLICFIDPGFDLDSNPGEYHEHPDESPVMISRGRPLFMEKNLREEREERWMVEQVVD